MHRHSAATHFSLSKQNPMRHTTTIRTQSSCFSTLKPYLHTTTTVSLKTLMAAKTLEESDVGISCYISKLPGFRGILKQRFLRKNLITLLVHFLVMHWNDLPKDLKFLLFLTVERCMENIELKFIQNQTFVFHCSMFSGYFLRDFLSSVFFYLTQ